MRSLMTIVITLTLGAASAHAQLLSFPISIPSTAETYIDNRSTCPYSDYIYFGDFNMYSNGRSVTYQVTNPANTPPAQLHPWSLHVLPHASGYAPSLLVAVCKQRYGITLSQCTDAFGGISGGLAGVNVPAQIGTFYIVVTHFDFEAPSACVDYTLTGVHH
ncbi:MAG: hypothetical protein ABIW82_01975 [Dokdonella sp.]